MWFAKRKQMACSRTFTAHIQNMITGVTKGYEYKMRAVYAHFPVNLVITDSTKLEIRNFLGERRVRTIIMLPGVEIAKSDVKDQLLLTGNSIEDVSKCCRRINMACKGRHKDIRKFLDGVYSESKGTVVKDEE